jgi:cytochrome c oxidase cbb3-type subunit 1
MPDSPLESTAPEAAPREPASAIDASLRWPILALATSAAAWLLAGLLLATIAAIKLHAPEFLASQPWLTLGRVRPAALNCILYGFASQAGFALAFWLLARLGGIRFPAALPTLAAYVLWNVAVTLGVGGILAGQSTGFAWLEMPRGAASLLLAAYILLGIFALITFQARTVRALYPTQWFVLGALFAFPWAFGAATQLLLADPVRGTLQAVINGWFTGVFSHLWLGGLALAALYYFLPRLANQPLHSSGLAAFAFWNLVFFGGFTGLTGLIGGPVPRWIPAVSGAATVCLLLPLACHLANWHLTVRGGRADALRGAWGSRPELGFLLVSVAACALSGLLEAAFAFPQVADLLGLTYLGPARQALFLHGFIGAALLGALYVILPAVAGTTLPSPGLVRAHLHLTLAGLVLLVAGLALGGVVQGLRLADASVPFLTVVKGTTPFVGLSTLGTTLLLLGQVCFLVQLGRLLRATCDTVCRPLWVFLGCCSPAKAGGKS